MGWQLVKLYYAENNKNVASASILYNSKMSVDYHQHWSGNWTFWSHAVYYGSLYTSCSCISKRTHLNTYVNKSLFQELKSSPIVHSSGVYIHQLVLNQQAGCITVTKLVLTAVALSGSEASRSLTNSRALKHIARQCINFLGAMQKVGVEQTSSNPSCLQACNAASELSHFTDVTIDG